MTAPALEPASGPVVQGAGSVVPRRLIGGALAVAGGALMVLAAFVPWVSGAAATTVVRGVSIDADGVGTVGSRAGWAGGDGMVFVISGALIAVVGAMAITRRYRVWHRPVLVGAAVMSTAWMWLDVKELGTVPGPDGSTLELSSGFGPVLVGLAVVLALAAAVLVPGDLVGRTWHAARVALRLDRIGLTRDSLEIRQRNLRLALRNPTEESLEPGDIEAMFADVCSDQAFHGHHEQARANARLLIDWIERRYRDDPPQLMQMRLAVADLLVWVDLGYAPSYVEWVWGDAVNRFDRGNPSLTWINSACNEVRASISAMAGALQAPSGSDRAGERGSSDLS